MLFDGARALQVSRPGLQEPSLIPSADGAIAEILLVLPDWAVTRPEFAQGYRSVIGELRRGTRFVVVHQDELDLISGWFTAAGHHLDQVTFVPVPGYVSLTDWAEDAYVALQDSDSPQTILMEPWTFARSGDALIAQYVQDFAGIPASQAPLIFQGGNILIGDSFWLLGRDYVAESAELLDSPRPPVKAPGQSIAETLRNLFNQYLDANRELLTLGTSRPIPLREYYATRSERGYTLDAPSGGVGAFQPIFHIDMFVTLLGRGEDGAYEVTVGSPRLADEVLGTVSPYALDDVYDAIAGALASAGMTVSRNPLVHRPTFVETRTLSEVDEAAAKRDSEDLRLAAAELRRLGAAADDVIHVRDWHHITWNNCLVENSESVGKHVYMPTYGASNPDLAPIDDEMEQWWTSRGFTVHRLADFSSFAERQGVVHCIKKYLARSA
ncbi:hypothetical protein [Microbacterium thalassium]|uniref:Agmatine deiminase n=1 Tax=Microbacterium thalassium TaxID=362649 RepID=A0A7X0KUF9_9MICO|nr:hypothetical protein [Microbacterium thalassium]MBB6391084.1 hypothetical protein [Microbacterium thalassium]GLK23805.1 hypothetical protein GCM10017607_11230 [Microbacterium thalassium]